VNDIAITVEDLGKQYHIGHVQTRYRTLRESITDVFVSPFRKAALLARGHAAAAHSLHESFWALRNVSFEVKRGEVLGVIGRNGAGKSTLLKVLTRITEPTAGFAQLRGRVASLLEVGTGFHPELTGRENVYLNGSILGMTRREIQRKFDEIVDFAEIAKFIDTPVKHYSSGMYLRLAFAVAANLDPDILLVDEVLAVGDAEFQRKCLGKMGDVASQGRTILFVSHNLGAVQGLCTRGIVLSNGQLTFDGAATNAVQEYLNSLEKSAAIGPAERPDRRGSGVSRVVGFDVVGSNGIPGIVVCGERVEFVIDVVPVVDHRVNCAFTIYDQQSNPITHFTTRNVSVDREDRASGTTRFSCDVGQFLLVPGRYRVNVAIQSDEGLLDHIESVMSFDVLPPEVSVQPRYSIPRIGQIVLPHGWNAQ